MATYSESERKALQEVPVEEILKVFGRSTEHGRDNLYLSPFRDEVSPSFHISRDGRKWYDFGMGKGGSVVTLVCMLLGCDGAKAYDFLSSVSSTYIRPTAPSDRPGQRTDAPGSRILINSADRNFRDGTLISYAKSRGISPAVLSEYCREISFSYAGHPGYRNSCIGFRNNGGGWILRAPDVKKCTVSDISTINIYGDLSVTPTSTRGLMFEGFFDFLSFVEMSGETWPKCDICVLNSVTNVRKAQDWIRSHKEICTLFDNDDAGRKALQDIKEYIAAPAAPCVKVNDWSYLYEGHNDLNERLSRGSHERENLTIQYQSLWNKTFQPKFRKD